MNKTTCQVAIVGCGLGGLAAAIALRRQGHDVIILDQAAQLSEVCTSIMHTSHKFPMGQTLKRKSLPLSRLAPAFRYRRTPLAS